MPNLGLDRYIVFIANITNRDAVTVNCFLFQIKNGQKLSVKRGKFDFLKGNSPLRVNEELLKNVFSGAETFNKIPNYEKEISYINNEDVKGNVNISNEYKGDIFARKTPEVPNTSVHQENIKHNFTPERAIVKTEKQNKDKSNNKWQESVDQNSTAKGETLLPKVESQVGSPRNQQEKKNSYNPNHTACTITYAKQPIRHETGLSQCAYTYHKDNESGSSTHCGQKLVKVTSFHTTVKTEIDKKRDMVSSLGDINFSGVVIASTTQLLNETGKEFRSDTNQTNSKANSIANNCENSNYERTSRGKEMINRKNAHPSKSPLQDRKVSLDHQINADQISHEIIEVKCTGQIGTTVGGQTITKQPSSSRSSLYDNVENSEIPTPMDTDEVEPITEIRPNTPSGAFQGTFSSSPNDEIDEDNELGWLCRQFAKMTLCGSGEK